MKKLFELIVKTIGTLVIIGFFLALYNGMNEDKDKQTAPQTVEQPIQSDNVNLDRPINKPVKDIPKDKDYSKVVDIAKRSDAPKFYDKWGKATIDRSNKLIKKAARKAEESPDCDSVEWVAMSDNMSKPDEIVWYADCTNGNRRYVSEKSL